MNRIALPQLGVDPGAPFPPPETALHQPDGLLAHGGDLSPERLLNAYRHGIFPWYSAGQPILWWSPDPRTLFQTDGVHLSRRFRRELRRCPWSIRADHAFSAVVSACADSPRRGQRGTWIVPAMQQAYAELHRLGHAHSVEVYADDTLVGGIYGVAVGRMFFGESMFSAQPGASKLALAGLALRLQAWGFPLIDAQVESEHLARLGSQSWPRSRFLAATTALAATQAQPGHWRERFGTLAARELAV